MGNTPSTPADPNRQTALTQAQPDATNAQAAPELTREEQQFTKIFSLGGTRFEIEKQTFLFGDSNDLSLLAQASLNKYSTVPQPRETNKKKTKPKGKPEPYLKDEIINQIKSPDYTSNDTQDVINPIHLLLNCRRASVRLTNQRNAKGKNGGQVYNLDFIYDAMCACAVKIDVYDNTQNIEFSDAYRAGSPIKKIFKSSKLKSGIAVKFSQELANASKDKNGLKINLDITEIQESIRARYYTQAAQSISKHGSVFSTAKSTAPFTGSDTGSIPSQSTVAGPVNMSSFYIVVSLYVPNTTKSQSNFQEQLTFILVEQSNEGLVKNENWTIKSVRQLCTVGNFQFLLNDIYGIENKKEIRNAFTEEASLDNLDEDGSCVVCLSDPRDTIMLPCRHLCLCNACADKLRYQHGNCPFCRMPFQALLRIKAIKHGRTRREYSLADALNKVNRTRKTKRSPEKRKSTTLNDKTIKNENAKVEKSSSSESSDSEDEKNKEKGDNDSTSLSNHGGSSIDNASFSEISDGVDSEKQGPAFGVKPTNMKSQQM